MVAEAIIKTQSGPMSRVLTTNATTAGTAPANPASQASAPSVGVIEGALQSSQFASNGLLILPYGVGTATNTFFLSIFAWDYIQPVVAQNAGMWVAWPLCAFTCTLGAITGLAGGEVDNTNLFAGTIVQTSGFGNANVSNEVISPTGNFLASIVLDTKGARRIQLLFGMNSSSTSANALWRKI